MTADTLRDQDELVRVGYTGYNKANTPRTAGPYVAYAGEPDIVARLTDLREIVWMDQNAARFNIKILHSEEDIAYSGAIQRKAELTDIIDRKIRQLISTDVRLVDLQITKGSINLGGIVDGAGGYRDIKDLITDLFQIFGDVLELVVDFFKNEALSEKSKQTAVSFGVGAVAGAVALAAGAPVLAVAAVGVAAYKIVGSFFKTDK